MSPESVSGNLVVFRRRRWSGPSTALVLALLGGVLAQLADSPAERLVGGSAATVFGLAAALLGARNLRRAPALVLDPSGFTDTASGAAAGFVPWSSVTGLVEQRMRSQRYLSVLVAEPAAVLARADEAGRAAMRANLVLLGTPVNIPLRPLDTGIADLTCAFARHTAAALPAMLTARLPAGTAPHPPATATDLAELITRAAAAGVSLPGAYLDLLAAQDGWCGSPRIHGSRPTEHLDGVVEATRAGQADGLPAGHVLLGQDDAYRYTWHNPSASYHILARSDHEPVVSASTLSDLFVTSTEKSSHPLG